MDNISSKIKVKKKTSPKRSPLSNKYKEFISSGGKVKVLSPRGNSKKRNKVNVVKVKKVDNIGKGTKEKKAEKVEKGIKEKKVDKGTKVEKVEKGIKEKKVDKGTNVDKNKPGFIMRSHKDKNKSKHKYTKENRQSKASKKRYVHKRHTKSRKVSLKCTPRKKKNIDKIFKSLENMSDDKIKTELLKQGIEFKSNNKKLLKDIYLFSSLGGIKVHRE